MKKIILFMIMAVAIASCKTVTVKGTVPPGQMKKATGSKSAAPYAPGQQKKAATGTQKKSNSAAKSAPGQKKKN